jgi:hypothetical protein
MTPLTPEELQIIATLIAETERLGYQPSISELAIVTRPGVHGFLSKIAAKGWISRTGLSRAIVISDEARRAVRDYLNGANACDAVQGWMDHAFDDMFCKRCKNPLLDSVRLKIDGQGPLCQDCANAVFESEPAKPAITTTTPAGEDVFCCRCNDPLAEADRYKIDGYGPMCPTCTKAMCRMLGMHFNEKLAKTNGENQ